MGQSVVALMYGVRASELDRRSLQDADGEWSWESGELSLEWGKCPTTAYEGDCLGFPVAASAGCSRDEGYLGETCKASEIPVQHLARVAAAKEKWDAFAAWLLKTHGKKLPKAELWITTDERG